MKAINLSSNKYEVKLSYVSYYTLQSNDTFLCQSFIGVLDLSTLICELVGLEFKADSYNRVTYSLRVSSLR